MDKWIDGWKAGARLKVGNFETLIQCIMEGLPVYDPETFTRIGHTKNNGEDLFYYTTIPGRSRIGFNLAELKQFVHRCLFKESEVESFAKDHGLEAHEQTEMSRTPQGEKSDRESGNENEEDTATKNAAAVLGRKGGEANKKNKVVKAALNKLYKDKPETRKWSAQQLWNYIGKHHPSTTPLSAGCWKLYIDGDTMCITGSGKKEDGIALSTFRAYVSEMKGSSR